MNALVPVLSLVSASLAASLSWIAPNEGAAETPENAPLVTEVYDLSSIALPERPDSRSVRFLPFLEPKLNYLEDTTELDVDDHASLLADVFGDELDYAGSHYAVLEDNTLVVRGTESLHAGLRELLGFVEETVGAAVTLEIELLRVRPGAELPSVTHVPVAELEGVLPAAADVVDRRTVRLDVTSARRSTVDLTRVTPVVLSVDAEIAQSSAILDPVVVNVGFGTRIEVRAAPSRHGTALALTLARGDLARLPASRTLGLRSVVQNEVGTSYDSQPSRVHEPDVLSRSLSLNTVLPANEALLLSTSLDVAGGSTRDLVVVRRLGGDLLAMASAPGEREVSLIDLQALSPPRAVASGELFAAEGPAGVRLAWNTGNLSTVDFVTSELGLGVNLREHDEWFRELESFSTESMGTWLVQYPFSRATEEEMQRDGRRAQEIVDALMPDDRIVSLDATLRRGGRDAPLASVRVPLRLGDRSTFVLGVEGLDVSDYDVEVAQHSATPDPSVFTTFDGLVLSVEPRRSPGGRIVLDLRAVGHVLHDRGYTELESPTFDRLDRRTFDELSLTERLVFDEAHTRRHVLGVRGADAGALHLELALTE